MKEIIIILVFVFGCQLIPEIPLPTYEIGPDDARLTGVFIDSEFSEGKFFYTFRVNTIEKTGRTFRVVISPGDVIKLRHSRKVRISDTVYNVTIQSGPQGLTLIYYDK